MHDMDIGHLLVDKIYFNDENLIFSLKQWIDMIIHYTVFLHQEFSF